MNNRFGNRAYSVRDLGRDRDHWWNRDFLELMSRRWRLQDRKRILDLGCGAGHWSRILFPYLSIDASICGLGQTATSAVESALARWNLFTEEEK